MDTIVVSFSEDTVPVQPSFEIEIDSTLPCSEPHKTLVGPDGFEVYLWSNGFSEQQFLVTTDGFYSLSVGNSLECLSEESETEFVAATSDIPQPFIQLNGDILISSSNIGNQWFLNGEFINGAINQFYTPTETGFYTVQVTIDNCSSQMSEFVNFAITSINNNFLDTQITVFPNPTSDIVRLNFAGDINVFKNVKLVSLLGVVIESNSLRSSIQSLEFSMQNLEQGMYLSLIHI